LTGPTENGLERAWCLACLSLFFNSSRQIPTAQQKQSILLGSLCLLMFSLPVSSSSSGWCLRFSNATILDSVTPDGTRSRYSNLLCCWSLPWHAAELARDVTHLTIVTTRKPSNTKPIRHVLDLEVLESRVTISLRICKCILLRGPLHRPGPLSPGQVVAAANKSSSRTPLLCCSKAKFLGSETTVNALKWQVYPWKADGYRDTAPR
jgi:hypothetical protein